MEIQPTTDEIKMAELLKENELLADKVTKMKMAWLALKEAGDSLND